MKKGKEYERAGQAIDGMFKLGMIPPKMIFLAREAVGISISRGDTNATISSCLTRLACTDWDKFISMVQRYGEEEAIDLKLIEFRNSRE